MSNFEMEEEESHWKGGWKKIGEGGVELRNVSSNNRSCGC